MLHYEFDFLKVVELCEIYVKEDSRKYEQINNYCRNKYWKFFFLDLIDNIFSFFLRGFLETLLLLLI